MHVDFVTPPVQRHDQLDLMMNLACAAGIRELAIVDHDIVRVLLEEKW
jgi:hypothetical protein